MTKDILHEDTLRIRVLLRDVLHSTVQPHLTRLGSMTNRTYRADLPDGRAYIVRIPGDGTQEMIERTVEKTSTMLADRLGIDAPLLYFGANGEKVSVCIPDAITMSPETMRTPERIRQAAQLLRTLHTCGEDMGSDFNVFTLAERYEDVAVRHGVRAFADYAAVKDAVLGIRDEQRKSSVRRVFCHNDPIYANWLVDRNGKMYLVDWEYAGMNDPMWDLADLSIESDFTADLDQALLTVYLQQEPDDLTIRRFLANKVYVDFLWSLWAKAREPFESDWVVEYGKMRFSRMQQHIVTYQKER
ncbi:MAG: phosphotransferase [Clostridia bacterium]|nr:phosphotransferase [Clostridia bacterium]